MGSKDYFFFTDVNQAPNPSGYINDQPPADAYGPVSTAAAAAGKDEYRVTSLHTATFNPTAYAACDAIVCVQKVTSNPALLNIILKPLVQPALNFAPVKYIIYKGILANSLIDANGTDVAPPANNDLTKFLWAEQAKKNASASPAPPATAPAAALGIGLTGTNFVDADPIDNLFFRAAVAFQLPKVDGGWSLGQFDKTNFGMEVLMEGLAFRHTLKLARQIENRISVQTLSGTGTETDAQKFDHWHDKEQILGFMDPCAFYGSFFRAGVKAKTSGNTPFAPKAGNTLYQDVLFPFANSDTAYLDIRNEHNFSFNYFGNYHDSIRVGDTLLLVDYYDSLWPILTLTAANFATANTTKARNAFRLQLPDGDNPKPLIYVSQGYRELRTRGKKFPEELTSAERFFDAFVPSMTGFTTPKATSGPSALSFVVPNVTGQTATTPVSCYIRIKYLKQEQGAATEPTVIKAANYLDNLIYPLDLKIPFDSPAIVKSAVYDEEIYVSAQTVPSLQCDFIGKVGIARDATNTTFFIIPTHIRTQTTQGSQLIALSGETSDFPGSYSALIAAKYDPERVKKGALSLSSTNQVPTAEFISDGGDAARAKFGNPDFDKVLFFVIANSTYDSWQGKITPPQDNRFRTYLGVKNLQTGTDTTGIAYTSFELVLRGFALDAGTGTYQVTELDTLAVSNVTMYVRSDLGSNAQVSPSTPAISIVPKKANYVVVLDKLGFAPSAYPVLEFDIKGPPNFFVDVQVSRDAPQLLAGGPGLANAWDKSQPPQARMSQIAFSSWTNGDQNIVLDASGKATYQMPLNWWKDLARLPVQTFGTANIRYRAVAWPSTSTTPTAWSTNDGATAPKVLVRGNLTSFEVIESGTLDFLVQGVLTNFTLGYIGPVKCAAMKFTVREANTTEMYTIVQWKRGSERRWPQSQHTTTIDYGIVHLNDNPDWTIDQTGTDPRYVDSVDVAAGNGFTVSVDKKSAMTNDTPGGAIANSVVSHSFLAMDFDSRIHLNFEVPAAVSIVKMEDIVFQDSSGAIYRLVQGEIAPPTPLIIDHKLWKARILQVRKTDGTIGSTYPDTYAGP